MSVTENPKKTDAPPIVKLNKALKLVNIIFAHLLLLKNKVYVLYVYEVVGELFDRHSFRFWSINYSDECFVRSVC